MAALIERDPRAASSGRYDLLVVGGGIQGATLALEASQQGFATLLVERGEFGAETTGSSLRIVHGGLRYLQSCDLRRYRESVAERRWFLRNFPDLVQPLPCLMPLYETPRGGRLRRPAAFRAAFAADAVLDEDRVLPRGRLLGLAETVEHFPEADRDGLCGGALWHDALVSDPHRLVTEILRWACHGGTKALHQVEAMELLTEGGRVQGVRAVDGESGRALEIQAERVVNCAGPWVRRLARRFDRDIPELFQPLIAFNLLLDREPPSSGAVAVASREPGAQTWFLVPWEGKLLAGTFYARVSEERFGGQAPGEPLIEEFLRELNAALPGAGLRREQVLRVLWGRLPAETAGSKVPSSRPVIHDHGAQGGPRGLISVSGVKLTTARAVAERTLRLLERSAERAA